MNRPPFLRVVAGKGDFYLQKTPYSDHYSIRNHKQRFALGGGDIDSLRSRWVAGVFDWAL